MEKIVYLFGAGFSAPLGIPVMSNFIEKSKDIYFNDTTRYENFKAIYKMIKDMAYLKNFVNSDLFNIEEILSVLEMGFMVGDNRKQLERYKEYLKDVITYYTPELSFAEPNTVRWHQHLFGREKKINLYGLFIANLLQLKISQLKGQGIGAEYNSGTGEVSNYKYSIVTLNYDLIVENYISYINSFLKNKNELFEVSSNYSSDSESNKLQIFKLHGCLSQDIIPPTWNKSNSNNVQILKAWKNAHKAIAEANQIRIVGYSLPITDSYIKYLLSVSLKNSEHLKKIDVITLDSDNSTKERYKSIFTFPKFRFKNARFEEFLELAYWDEPGSYPNTKINIRESDHHSPLGGYKKKTIDLKASYIEKSHDLFMTSN